MKTLILTIGLFFLCPLLTIGQNERFDTYLTIGGSNVSFYRFQYFGSYNKFSPKPTTVFNASAKMFWSKNLALFLQAGYLKKKYSSDIIDIYQSQNYSHSWQRHEDYSVSSIIGVLGLQRQFQMNDNFKLNIGLGVSSKFDLNYKYIGDGISMHRQDTAAITSWTQTSTEVTTKGNQGLGLSASGGIDIKLSKNLFLNTSVQYSYYKYFGHPIQTTKRKTLNLLTNTTTEIETDFDPNSPNVFSTRTGGSNYFGRTDLIFSIGLTYKLK